MKLALVSVDEIEALPPLGLGYLASYLRKYHDFNNTIIVDKENQLKRIEKEKPDVVGISATTIDFNKALNLAEQIKSKFDLPTLIGGFHITALPHTLQDCFDVGVVGEGEITLVELVKLFEDTGEFSPKGLEKIQGICYHENDKIRQTPRRPIIEPLDSIPYPARDLMKINEYYLKPARHTNDKLSRGTSIITTRGCMFKCVFCSQTGFWQHSMRFHSPEYIVREMEGLIKTYPKIEMIRIMDDLFVVKPSRIKRISELVQEKGINDKVDFHVFGRTNLINDKMARYLTEMGCNYINFGLESGSEKVLSYLKRKSVTVKQHYNALEVCGKYGMNIDASFIFGSPTETVEDIKETFKLVRDPNLKHVMFFKLTPLPQSALWGLAKEKGLVSDDMDWDLLTAGIDPRSPYLGDIPKDEFFNEVGPMILEEYRRKNYQFLPKITLSHLLDIRLWKRFFSNTKGFSSEFTQRAYNELLKKKEDAL